MNNFYKIGDKVLDEAFGETGTVVYIDDDEAAPYLVLFVDHETGTRTTSFYSEEELDTYAKPSLPEELN